MSFRKNSMFPLKPAIVIEQFGMNGKCSYVRLAKRYNTGYNYGGVASLTFTLGPGVY